MKLKVGIMGESSGWKSILNQIGVSYSIAANNLQSNEYSAIVASDNIKQSEVEFLRNYIIKGGALLCSANLYSKIDKSLKTKNIYVKYLVKEEGSIFTSLTLIDVQRKCKILKSANAIKTNRNVLSTYIDLQHKHVIALPFNPGKLINDERTITKSFYSPESPLPFEHVSAITKGQILNLVSECLELLHHSRGLPYIRIHHLPHAAKSIFCFRIDTDRSTKNDIESLYTIVHKHGIKATWFVDVKSNKGFLDLYKKMKNQEIGVHCFEHITYKDYKNNLKNIQTAQKLLQKAGLRAKGFASPYGKWNQQLGKAISDSRFEYSSEFAYDYDSLPSYPKGIQKTSALQIPIHPICIGSLRQQGYNIKQMIHYFDWVLENKSSKHEPILIYHHPKDNNHLVLEWLFKRIKKMKLPIYSMMEYAKWWKKRSSNNLNISLSNNNVIITGINADKSLYLNITMPNGKVALIKLSGKINLKNIKWKDKPTNFSLPDDYLRITKFDYRIPLIKIWDNIIKFLRSL